MSFRKELKYKMNRHEMAEMKSFLLELGMYELHPSRIINSCYYDTNDMSSFFDSEEGVLPRKKIRVRWYDNDLIFTKEVKISSIEGRYKLSDEVPFIRNHYEATHQTYYDNLYGSIYPTMLVSYEREYFFLNQMRITFDKNIIYKRLHPYTELMMRDFECVMEIKVPIDCSDAYIQANIQIPTTRFSKYCRGLLIFEQMLF